jgi:phosphoribosylanthranilate isomerase
VRVKICGVKSPADARAAVEAGADLIGLNFYPPSPRAVDAESAAAIVAGLPERVWRVGVFVNASRSEMASLVARLGLSAIQLHGDEPEELERGWNVKVIRAVRLTSELCLARAASRFAPDYFLCEGSACGGYGGAGIGFDWRWARGVDAARLIVAGGLTAENVAEAVRVVRPFAVDVATGVERAPGVKDPARMAEFVANAKAA